jgi:uncharacterized protein (TIGR02391 family)
MPTKSMKKTTPFRTEDIEAISRVLAETDTGLTGGEIGKILADCRIKDITPQLTKWKRLYNALGQKQSQEKSGNHIVGFIHKAMSPVRFVGMADQFAFLRGELNTVLSFSGLTLGEGGRLANTSKASTLGEAEERASSLKAHLSSRNVHIDVLAFCQAELLKKNYFHAVFEATKSVADKIRKQSGLTSDGADLATAAFSLGKSGKPILRINPLMSDTEKSEQRGFVNLLIGLFGTFRNPVAHEAKIFWPVNEQDALDILSLVSLVHRKLDSVLKD